MTTSMRRIDLDRGGGAAAGPGPRRAAGEVVADEVEDLVVVEQPVELLQLGLEAQAELGDQREQIGPIVAVLSMPTAYKRP